MDWGQTSMDFSAMTDWVGSHGTTWFAASLVVFLAFLGMLLTAIMMPGAWVTIAGVFAIYWFWKPELVDSPWWTFGSAVALATLGEVIEFAAGAAGATKGGSSRSGAIGAMVGSIVGAILMAPIVPPLGMIAGGVLGAAGGTVLVERGIKKKTWEESTRAGKGAAIGRIIATVSKTLFAVAIGMIMIAAAFW
ncbi:MAG: DUF456 domain-containing protein [Phycisphaerales bacterium]